MSTVNGTDHPDFLFGTGGEDRIRGKDGNDTIEAFGGDDRIRGGDGDDLIYAGAGDDRVRGDDGNDFIYGEDGDDRIRGRDGNDYIEGGAGADTIDGGKDHDELIGGTGDDLLNGGSGDDILTGGAGADNFLIVSPSDGVDEITDFDFFEGDKVLIDSSGFGTTSTSDFTSEFDFATGTAELFFEPASGGSTLIAELTNLNADFEFIPNLDIDFV